LYADQARQHYFAVNRGESSHCKSEEPSSYESEQTQPLLNSRTFEYVICYKASATLAKNPKKEMYDTKTYRVQILSEHN
jgi:hypothetical protein